MKTLRSDCNDATGCCGNEMTGQLPQTLNIEPKPQRTLWSLGHSTRSAEELLERLLAHSIDRVVDVRTKPYSRWHSQFNREQLAYFLAMHDLNYDWRGRNLGGLDENVDYDATIAELYELAATERIALLCSEASPQKCHRYLVLTPSLEKLGASVTHITYPPR